MTMLNHQSIVLSVLAAATMEPMAEPHPAPETTASLLLRCRTGNESARDQLIRRFLPLLRRWAHGRLPPAGRDLALTDDLVQITLIRALDNIGRFEARHEGAFLAYLRRILLNQIRDELRRAGRRPRAHPPQGPEELLVEQRSPVESVVGLQALEAYEEALSELSVSDREAVLMRLEFGYSYKEIAESLGLASDNAARMRVSRAIAKVAGVIDVSKIKS